MINKETLYFYQMTNLYYEELGGINEFQDDAERGHGVMVIDLNDLLVAVPLRSKIKPYSINATHLFPYTEYYDSISNENYIKALDFSKTTIIKESHINTKTSYIFRDENEKKFYIDNFSRLRVRLTNYISRYITICNKISNNEKVTYIMVKPYLFTTLSNFHNELCITLKQDEFYDFLSNVK